MSNVPETTPATEGLTTPQTIEQVPANVPAVKPRVVIIGAGFGGLRAAKALRDAPVQVTVIDRQNHHVFQPLLYWVATAGLSPADICAPIRQVLGRQKNAEVLMAEVTGIDIQAQKVLMHERSVSYDYLIVATGAVDNYFGHKDWEQCAPGLKSIVDATKIRRRILLAFEAAEIEPDPEKIKELLTFVLVGAGPTGVELAGAIAEIAHKTLVSDFRHIDPKLARIILVEAAPRILATFPKSLSRKSQQKLARMGVEVRAGTPVTAIDENGVVVGGERIAAKTVIWSAGVAASPAGTWLGAEVDRGGRVKVENDLTLPGHPNIFVIGDTASFTQNGKPLPGVAPVAMQAGRYVASVIVGRVAGKQQAQAFHYHDKGNLATVGRSYAIVALGRLRVTGLIAWLMWIVVHIYYLIGFRNRFVALFQWAWTYFTYHRGARLITFDEKFPLP
jgi:NADH:ubiquinone reductase (H+-translocating)